MLNGCSQHQADVDQQLIKILLETNPQSATASNSHKSDISINPEQGSPPQSKHAFKRPLFIVLRVGLISQSPPKNLRIRSEGICMHQSGVVLNELQLGHILKTSKPGFVQCSTTSPLGIMVNGQAYMGQVDLINRGEGWIAVNQINIENYVASVVGAEMPSSWHIEALKAQAVAARSYALAHMARSADRDFDLGDATRWQAYSGLSSQTARTMQATDATQGIVLSYRGGIVESLYAATGAISQEAHGHLGASMSQHGAQALAKQGLRFDQILSRYYRGAQLARLQSRDN